MTKTGKPRKKTKAVEMSQIKQRWDNTEQKVSIIEDSINKMNDSLNKSVEAVKFREIDKKVDRNKITFNAHQYDIDNIQEKGWERISDEEQKSIAQLDPYISSIISKRTAQAAIVGRPSESKFDKGARIQDINPPVREDYKSDEEFKKATDQRQEQMQNLLKWVMTCGYADEEFLNTLFKNSDPSFKTCAFHEYVSAQVRNLLTFGRAARQTFRDENGLPVIFRPVPVEVIRHFKPKTYGADISTGLDTSPQSVEDAREWNALPKSDRPMAFAQVVDGQNVNFLTEQDLKMLYLQKQALFDLRGYPLSPIELAIYMVFVHNQTMGYLRNQFVKGIATKSIMVIESTEPGYQLPDEDLDALRREFHNYLMRTDNSAVTPVISGPIKVSMVQMTPSPKDMEFLQLEDHIIRALCSAMLTSPQEMGYGYLGTPQGGISNGGKQEEIIRGEETGLRILLDIVFDDVNEVLSECFTDFKDNFRVVYVGVGEDTRDTVVQRSMQELNTTATMNSLLADSDKSEVAPFGGDVFLSPNFMANVISNITYAEFRYYFLKDKEALQKPEYQFIMNPNLEQLRQGLISNPPELQLQQNKLQMEMMQQQGQMQAAQMQAGQPQEDPEPRPNGGKATLADKYKDSELKKSATYYFESWMKANENID